MAKVIQGLVVAAVLAFAGLAWRVIVIRQAEASMQQAITGFGQQQQVMAQQQQQRQLMAQADERARRVLAQDQRCVGGTVITVHGAVYTQDIGADGHPIRCTGSLAVVPLR